MLTGLTRYRLGWRKKMVLQVSEWRLTCSPGRAPWLEKYRAVWRDATFRDVIDLEQRNFSAEAPEVQGPPERPPRNNRDRPPEVRNTPPTVVREDLPAEPIYMYGVTGEER